MSKKWNKDKIIYVVSMIILLTVIRISLTYLKYAIWYKLFFLMFSNIMGFNYFDNFMFKGAGI